MGIMIFKNSDSQELKKKFLLTNAPKGSQEEGLTLCVSKGVETP